MAGNLSNYDFGGGGVNIVKNPLELADNEATQLQNAELVPDEAKGGEGSLSKRGGLLALTTALAGSVLGMIALPLQTTYTRTLYVFKGSANSDTAYKTTDGVTWTAVATPLAAARWQDKYHALAGQSSLVNCYHRAVSYKQVVLYAGDSYTVDTTAPPVVAFDGMSGYELFRIPQGSNSTLTPTVITDMLAANGKVYFCVAERAATGAFHGGRVLCYDPRIAKVYQIANAIGTQSGEVTGQNNPTCLAWYQGQLFCGLHATNSGSADVGKVIRCYPDIDTSWTTDVSNLNGKPDCLLEFKGNLYCGTSISDGVGTISKRTASTGAWTDVESLNQAHCLQLINYSDTLYYIRYVDDAADSIVIRKSSDGTTWSTDRDVYGTDASSTLIKPVGSMVYGGDLYFAFEPITSSDTGTGGFVLQLHNGTWSKVLTANIAGPFVTLVERS
jgi:hypothetical protein